MRKQIIPLVSWRSRARKGFRAAVWETPRHMHGHAPSRDSTAVGSAKGGPPQPSHRPRRPPCPQPPCADGPVGWLRGWGMCESHVSNPQTVGKCCSLLNSAASRPPLLHSSPRLSVCSLFGQAVCPASSPWVCLCVCALVCPHVSVCVCVCPAPSLWVCLAAHRKSKESGCQRHAAWNYHFLQTDSMPTTPPLSHTDTNTHLHTHTHTHPSLYPSLFLLDFLTERTSLPEEGGTHTQSILSLLNFSHYLLFSSLFHSGAVHFWFDPIQDIS